MALEKHEESNQTPTKTTKPYSDRFDFDHKAYEFYLTGAANQVLIETKLDESIKNLRDAWNENLKRKGYYNRAQADLAYSLVLKAEFNKVDNLPLSNECMSQADEISLLAWNADKTHKHDGFEGFDYSAWWARAFYFQIAGKYVDSTDTFCTADVKLFSKKTDPEEKRNNFRVEYLEAIAWELRFQSGTTKKPDHAPEDKRVPGGNYGTRREWLVAKAEQLIEEYETPSGQQLWSIAFAKYALYNFEDALKIFRNKKLVPGHRDYIPLMGTTLSLILWEIRDEEVKSEFEAFYSICIASNLKGGLRSFGAESGDEEILRDLNYIFSSSNSLLLEDKVMAFHSRFVGEEAWAIAVQNELMEFDTKLDATRGETPWHHKLNSVNNNASQFINQNAERFEKPQLE